MDHQGGRLHQAPRRRACWPACHSPILDTEPDYFEGVSLTALAKPTRLAQGHPQRPSRRGPQEIRDQEPRAGPRLELWQGPNRNRRPRVEHWPRSQCCNSRRGSSGQNHKSTVRKFLAWLHPSTEEKGNTTVCGKRLTRRDPFL